MFKHGKWLSVGLLTLLGAGAALVLFRSPAEAGKPTKPPPPQMPVYTMELLSPPEGVTHACATSINNHGWVAGFMDLGNYPGYSPDRRGFVFIPGTGIIDVLPPIEPPVEPPGPDDPLVYLDPRFERVNDINDLGDVVGRRVDYEWRWDADDGRWNRHRVRFWAFRYTVGGGWVDLGTVATLPEYGDMYPAAVNNQGQVVGFVDTWLGGYGTPTRAFVWTEGVGAQEVPGMVAAIGPDADCEAWDINDFGEITGRMTVNGESRAFRYVPGKPIQDLGVLRKFKSGGSVSVGTAINFFGDVAGYSKVGQSVSGSTIHHAFRYTDEQGMVDLGTLEKGKDSGAYAINAAGHVVGWSEFVAQGASNPGNNICPFLYTDETGMLDLWSLVENPQGTSNFDVLYGLHSINNNGEIAGSVWVEGQGDTPFILRPKSPTP